jgi:hypothetical protein
MRTIQSGGMFEITAGGLKPIVQSGIFMAPGVECFIGYSNSPDRAIVSRIEPDASQHGGAWVYFYRNEYQRERRESRLIFCDLATKGTVARLKMMQGCVMDGQDWAVRQAADLSAILEGRAPAKLHDHRDSQPVTLRVVYSGKGEGWREFEQSFPNEVSGQDNTGVQPCLVIHTSRAAAAEMTAWCGHDKGAEFLAAGTRDGRIN